MTLLVHFTLALALVGVAYCVPLPKCTNGFGLIHLPITPTDWLGTAQPGECIRCLDKNCGACEKYNKNCRKCLPGYGLNSMKKCVSCASSTCGVCAANPSVCNTQQTKCPSTPIKTYAPVKRAAWKGAYCGAFPGVQSTGYSRSFTALVKGGKCYDCGTSDFRDTFKPLKFCDFAERARRVAISPFYGASTASCKFPQNAVATLTGACYRKQGNYPFGEFPFDFVFKVSFCGSTKAVHVRGGWKVSINTATQNFIYGILPLSKWSWSTK